jgi:signal transduction histidine kinase
MSFGRHGGGLVIALRRDGRFARADRDALRAFADSVAQRLAAERSVEIERLRHGIEARERERTRWAREIHDETVQGLGALRLMLANARDLDDSVALRETVERAIEELGAEIEGLRHLITELRPAALDDLGLVPALQALARRAYAIDGLDVETQIELGNGASERLDPELESTIYRVVQEALTNVCRHANATRASVSVSEHGGVLHVAVSDDGRAAPSAPRDPREARSGFGIAGMRERAELVGGELAMTTRPGAGTTVELRVPLAPGAVAR